MRVNACRVEHYFARRRAQCAARRHHGLRRAVERVCGWRVEREVHKVKRLGGLVVCANGFDVGTATARGLDWLVRLGGLGGLLFGNDQRRETRLRLLTLGLTYRFEHFSHYGSPA